MNNSNEQVTFEQLAERYRRGERPEVNDYAECYPEFAEQIHDLFPAMVMMEERRQDFKGHVAFQ